MAKRKRIKRSFLLIYSVFTKKSFYVFPRKNNMKIKIEWDAKTLFNNWDSINLKRTKCATEEEFL